jgi:hypothetical protein
MKFIEISYNNIKSEIERFLRKEHRKSNINFDKSSPFGQILDIVENLFQLSFLYLKNSIKNFDLSNPNSLNEKIIKNSAIFSGHIPGRSISSTGNLKLIVKSGINIESEIPGGRVTIFRNTQLRNKTNNLSYSININQDSITYNINTNTQIFLPIIQGEFRRVTYTGNGEKNQTLPLTIRGGGDIENFNVEVLVNGETWEVKKHIYEMSPNEKAVVVRTGFDGGVDIIFGNGGFGEIPPPSSIIEISYLVSSGSGGNIYRRTPNDWTFQDSILDGFGNPVDITKVFDILIFNDINFGSDKESVLFTKNILPISSNNFVLGTPRQYSYQIKRLGVFSHVNAYEDDTIVHIVATPNIKLFKNRNSDYFSVSKNAFVLDDYEKSKISKYLRSGGNIQLTKRWVIDSPKLSYYIMNVFIIRYSDSSDDGIKAQIIDKVSEYFLNLNRIGRIPKSDLIKEITSITDIHSVDIEFISRKNEEYHRENLKRIERKKILLDSEDLPIDDIDIEEDWEYDENLTLGIDPVMGDILFEPDEIPIIRGGWYERTGVYFSDNINDVSLKSLNIIRRGIIDSSNRNKF